MYLTIDEIKKHLNIDEYFKEDDSYLMTLCEVSEAIVERHIDANLKEVAESEGGKLPPPLLHAIKLYIGDLYKYRESIAFGGGVAEIPFNYDYILSLYKNYNRK